MLAEIQRRSSSGNADTIGSVRSERFPVGKTECAVEVGQERIGRALIGIVHARFEGVFASDIVEIVLCLPGIYDSAFRKCAIQAERQQAGVSESCAADCLIDVRCQTEQCRWCWWQKPHSAG